MYDEWIWSPLVLAFHAGTLHPAALWAQQDSHRSLVPTAIALGLSALDGWDIRVEALVGVALTALAQVALWHLLRRRLGNDGAARPFLIASLVLYALTQSENWLWGFQLSWFLVNACALGAVAMLDGTELRALRVAAAVGTALIASFSLIFGFAVWIAGAVVLALHRARLSLLVWLLLALVASAAFLWHYHRPAFENGWIANAPAPLFDGVGFVLVYLGAPLGIFGGPYLSGALGVALLAAFAYALSTGERGGSAPWIALLAFALVAATFEMIGRGGTGVEAALAFRYTTPSSLAWIGLVGLLATSKPPTPQPMRRAFAIGAVALFVAANCAGAFEALQLIGAQHAAYIVLRNPAAYDDEELALYVNWPPLLRAQAAALRAAGLGPYHDPAFSRSAR